MKGDSQNFSGKTDNEITNRLGYTSVKTASVIVNTGKQSTQGMAERRDV